MSPPDPLTAAEDDRAQVALNRWLEQQSAEARIDWALANLAGPHVLSTSFGAQSAAMLHLLTRQAPDIAVVLVDTGYLFPETYRFADRAALNEGLFTGIAAAHCEPRNSALIATWSEVAIRQVWRETGDRCRESDRWDGNVGQDLLLSGNVERDFTLPCAARDDPVDFAGRYQVSTRRFQDACALRDIAQRTFRVTLMLSCVAAVVAFRIIRDWPQSGRSRGSGAT